LTSYAQINVRDLVLPIVEVERNGSELNYRSLLGTAFSVQKASLLLTAKHVFYSKPHKIALQVINNQWWSVGLDLLAAHPTEDVAILKPHWTQIPSGALRVTTSRENASCHYHVWGYPEDVLFDLSEPDSFGKTLGVPDLVFSAGHVRRRFSGPIPGLIGSNFYEMSNIAGSGCSGGPVINGYRKPYDSVIGIYVGERFSSSSGNYKAISYSARFDDIADWLRDYNVIS
jgi:hypothetical protein